MASVRTRLVLEQTNRPPPRQWTLTSDRLTIGRDPMSDVAIDDPRVSRHHAELVHDDGGWSLADSGSANGTFLNGARVSATAVHPGDRIRVGDTELVLTGLQPDDTEAPTTFVAQSAAPSVIYNVPSQHGTNWNVAGDQYTNQQWIEYRDSSLAFIANRRGLAKQLLVWGVLLYVGGTGLAMVAILSFQKQVFDAIDSQSAEPPDLPDAFIPMFGAGALISLVGIALFIFGLIIRSGAKRRTRELEVAPPWLTTSGT